MIKVAQALLPVPGDKDAIVQAAQTRMSVLLFRRAFGTEVPLPFATN